MAEKRSLLVGLALHERGRGHIKNQEYALALVLLLEADRQFRYVTCFRTETVASKTSNDLS